MKEYKKIDILKQRIIFILEKLPKGAIEYELKLLITEYFKQVDKTVKEVKNLCKTKLSKKE